MRGLGQLHVRAMMRIQMKNFRLGQELVGRPDARNLLRPRVVGFVRNVCDDHFENLVDEIDIGKGGIRVFAREFDSSDVRSECDGRIGPIQ